MARNALNNKIGKTTKYRRQFDDFYNFGIYGDCCEILSKGQMYVNQFHTWWGAMLVNLANTAISPNIYLMKCNTLLQCLLFTYAISILAQGTIDCIP